MFHQVKTDVDHVGCVIAVIAARASRIVCCQNRRRQIPRTTVPRRLAGSPSGIRTGVWAGKVQTAAGDVTWHSYVMAEGAAVGEIRRSVLTNGTTTVAPLLLPVGCAKFGCGDHRPEWRIAGKRRLRCPGRMPRRPNGSDAGFYTFTSQSARGYIGQYQVTNNLIDLNARYYDALLGRFLGVDPMTGSDPFDLQNWNAYSYAGNNPMAFSDPTGLCKGVFGCIGDFFGSFLRHNSWAGQVLVIGVTFLCGPAAPACAIASAAATQVGVSLLEGQQIGQALESGAIVGAEALAFNAVGGATGITDAKGNFIEGGSLKLAEYPAEFAGNVAGHAIVGGTFSVIQGGKFGSGALAAGFSAGLTPYLGDLGAGDMRSAGGIAKGTAVLAVVGGTASVLGGGKFANGAQTAAFGYLFNAAAGRLAGRWAGGALAGAAGVETGPLDVAIVAAGRWLGGIIGDNLENWAMSAADNSATASPLAKSLASQQQMGEPGSPIAGSDLNSNLPPIKDINRLLNQYGGEAVDWSKMSSSSYRATDGTGFQTHWYENGSTGQRFELKTAFPRN